MGAEELVGRARGRARVSRYVARRSAGERLRSELVDTGSMTLRATSVDLDVLRDLVSAGEVLAALDLAESLDVRERRAGMDALHRVLGAFRG